MRILFSSLSFPGHLNPLLPYAKALRDRGHEVRVAAPKAAAEKLQKAGLAHVAYEDTSHEEIVVAFEGEEGMSEEEMARAPKIEFREKVFNFGNMQQRSSVEHDFVFTNTGKSDLLIRKVSSSCGCTAVSPKEKTIKPGQSSSIKAIFSSGTRVGRQNKSITIITNDPVSPNVILRVSGTVTAPDAK